MNRHNSGRELPAGNTLPKNSAGKPMLYQHFIICHAELRQHADCVEWCGNRANLRTCTTIIRSGNCLPLLWMSIPAARQLCKMRRWRRDEGEPRTGNREL